MMQHNLEGKGIINIKFSISSTVVFYKRVKKTVGKFNRKWYNFHVLVKVKGHHID